jgi:5-methylcytosine-specific restriction endonuclease McrA
MQRQAIFARDHNRCVYCGNVFEADELTVDHLQPRVRSGDRSGGNLVTACRDCNTRKGAKRLAVFLASDPIALRNFFRYSTSAWPRHMRLLEEELHQMGLWPLHPDHEPGIIAPSPSRR